MKALLSLQDLDLRIGQYKAREIEIPKQKSKFATQRQRLEEELADRVKRVKDIQIEIHTCETDVGELQQKINKYQVQLLSLKKNEEYTALLHEIDLVKSMIGAKEDQVLTLMEQLDLQKVRLDEDRKRIAIELASLDQECAEVDAELAETQGLRAELEKQRGPAATKVEPLLLAKYDRIRRKFSIAVAALRDETCSGCNMSVLPQRVNEVLSGKTQTCNLCGRLLYVNYND